MYIYTYQYYIKRQNKFEFFLNINSHFLVILYYFGNNTIKISFIITVLFFSCNDKCLVYLLLEGLTAVYYAILERERANYCFLKIMYNVVLFYI